jgi:hypothetical protein
MLGYLKCHVPDRDGDGDGVDGIITVKTPHLIPEKGNVINPKHAAYQCSQFTVLKIKLFINPPRTISEIEGLSWSSKYNTLISQVFQLNQTIDNQHQFRLFKNKKMLINEIRFQPNHVKNAWYRRYYLDGRLSMAYYYNNLGIREKIINTYTTATSSSIKIIHNLKKNKTIYIETPLTHTHTPTKRLVFNGRIDFHNYTNINLIHDIIQYKRNKLDGYHKTFDIAGVLIQKTGFKNGKVCGIFWDNLYTPLPFLYVSGRCIGPYKMKLPLDFIKNRIVIF